MAQMLMPKGIKRDRSDMRIESHYTGKDHINKGYKTTFYYKHADDVGKDNLEGDFHGDTKEFYVYKPGETRLTASNTVEWFEEEQERSPRVVKIHYLLNMAFKFATFTAGAVLSYAIYLTAK